MAGYTLHRVTALPGTLEANAIYFVAHPTQTDLLEIVVTGNTGTARREVINRQMVQDMINASITASSSTRVYNTFADRPAATLDIPEGSTAFVIDASDDPSVNSGGATYILRHGGTPAWIKISESESLDLSLTWASITGKPSSTPANIDLAVTQRHTHANKTQLDKIGEADGLLTYDGKLPTPGWTTSAW